MTAELRSSLRKSLRKARRALTPRQQRLAALRLLRLTVGRRHFRAARHIAFYLPIDGEIDPRPLLQHALRHGKACYVPVISGRDPQRMDFIRVGHKDRLLPNRWGISEPRRALSKRIAPWALDLVFVPMTGFDSSGTRLGMGKGFYDRAFAFRKTRQRSRPLLVGLAHECQRHEGLPREGWDIPMDEIISDRRVHVPA